MGFWATAALVVFVLLVVVGGIWYGFGMKVGDECKIAMVRETSELKPPSIEFKCGKLDNASLMGNLTETLNETMNMTNGTW